VSLSNLSNIIGLRRLDERPSDPMNADGAPKARSCATCPFRIANQREGGRTFYPPLYMDGIWAGWDTERAELAIRNGALNHCHSTPTHPCAGAVALQDREVLRFVERRPRATGDYALTRMGLEKAAARLLRIPVRNVSGIAVETFRKRVSIATLRRAGRRRVLAAAHPAVSDPQIGHHRVRAPSRAEQRAWRRNAD
jgi:hypothetical protein